VAELDGPTRELRLLIDHRATLVREPTRIHSRWHLHELSPELHVRPRGLRATTTLVRVTVALDGFDWLVTESASLLSAGRTSCAQLGFAAQVHNSTWPTHDPEDFLDAIELSGQV
jgi:hypothetical protein